MSRYLAKGRMAVVEGSLQMRDWTDKEGNKRRSAEVKADSVYFADAKKDGDSGPQNANSAGNSYPAQTADGAQFSEVEDDGELPF